MRYSKFLGHLMTGLLLVFQVACGPKGNPSAIKVAAGSATEESRGSVWLVEGAQGGRLFLCGTIHLLREQDYPLAEIYGTAYEQSDELIFELPPGTSQSGALASRMAELGRLPNGERLEDLVEEGDWNRVVAWGKKRGLDRSAINGFRPWYLSLIMVSLEYAHLGATPDRGVEQVFEERASRDGKLGRGLETAEFQLQLFAGMSAGQEKAILRQTLDELDTVEAEFEQMIGYWKDGNIDELHELLMREAQQYPDLMDAFLVKRNRAWLPPLVAVLESGGRAMVLVGAGHLGGPEGLIALLEGKGYRVRRASAVGGG